MSETATPAPEASAATSTPVPVVTTETATEGAKAPAAQTSTPPPPIRRSGDMREILDSVIAHQEHEAKTAEAEAKSTPPEPKKAAHGEEPEKPASDPIPGEKAEAKVADEPAEKPADTSEKAEEADEVEVPKKVGEALKAIADPKVRGEIRGAIFREKAYAELMPLSEAKERKMLAPTLEVEREVHSVAQHALKLQGAFASGDPEGVRYFADTLQRESPQAYAQLVEHALASNENVRLNERSEGAKTLVSYMRSLTRAGNDLHGIASEDFERAAEIVEAVLGFKATDQRAPQRPTAPPEVQQELETLRAEKANRNQVDQQRWLQGIDQQYRTAFMGDVQKTIKAADPDGLWSQQAVQKLTGEIASKVVAATRNNPQLGPSVKHLVQRGASQQEVVSHLLSNARGLLGVIARDEIAAFRSVYGSMRSQREDKQNAAASRRDIGTAGASLRPAAAPEVQFRKGATSLEMLDQYAAAFAPR